MRRKLRRPPSVQHTVKRLQKLEKDPSISAGQKAVAALDLHHTLGTDPQFWQGLKNLANIDLHDCPQLSPLLQKLAADKLSKTQAVLVGDLAYATQRLGSLGTRFCNFYIGALATRNSYRAIELIKHLKYPEAMLVPLYLRAQQFAAAEAAAHSLKHLPDWIVVEFVCAYASKKDLANTNLWLGRLQAPSPEIIRKIHHFLLLYNLPVNLPMFGIYNQERPQLSPADKGVVAEVNKLLVAYPEALYEDHIYQKWATLLVGNTAALQDVIHDVAHAVDLAPGSLTRLLKRLPKDLALWLVDKMNYDEKYPRLTPRDWCVVLAKMSPEDNIAFMLEQIKYGECLNSSVVSALCRFDGLPGLCEIVLNCDQKTPDQILAAWKSRPTSQQAVALSQHSLGFNFSLLRAIVHALALHHNYVGIGAWLRHYRGITVPSELVADLPALCRGKSVGSKRFSAPQQGEFDWERALRESIPSGIDGDWVVEQVQRLAL